MSKAEQYSERSAGAESSLAANVCSAQLETVLFFCVYVLSTLLVKAKL